MIGMRLADELDLDVADRAALFYALLLKDAGCSSTAARLTALYGADDLAAKRDARMHQPLAASAKRSRYVVRNAAGSAGSRSRRCAPASTTGARRWPRSAASAAPRSPACSACPGRRRPRSTRSTSTGTARAILGGLRARRSRCSAADPLPVADGRGVPHAATASNAACLWRAQRSGTGSTRARVRAALGVSGRRPASGRPCAAAAARARRGARAPEIACSAPTTSALDRVAEAFARVIDAKSPYTFTHSERVARSPSRIGTQLGFDPVAAARPRRAGLPPRHRQARRSRTGSSTSRSC